MAYRCRVQTSPTLFYDISEMNAVLKELYRNAEDKFACLCLVYKDIRAIVIKYFRQQKPWLIETEVERRADTLLKTSYEEYKKEKDKKFNALRRSLRKVINGQSICVCDRNKIDFTSNSIGRKSNYTTLEGFLDNEDCKCYTTCTQQYERDDFLRPLERFVTMNRSFKLKLKHLDNEKYGYLDTDVSNYRNKREENKQEEPVTSGTLNKGFEVKLQDASTPNTKVPKYKSYFLSKFSEDTQKNFCKPLETPTCQSIHCGKGENKSDAVKNHREKTFVKEKSTITEYKRLNKDRVIIEFVHCDKHCFLCYLGQDSFEPQLVYCKNHCPQCITVQKANSSQKVLRSETNIKNNITTPPIDKRQHRSKLEMRFPRATKKPLISNEKDCLPSKSRFENHFIEKENIMPAKNENINQECVKEGINMLEQNVEEFHFKLDDYLEWDFMDLEPSSNVKDKSRWSNTANMLENIRNNHLKPIKKDLHDMQKHFQNLKHKYKY